MIKRRISTVLSLVLCILLLSTIGSARETGSSFSEVEARAANNASEPKDGEDELVVLDENAPMKIAVDNYMRKKEADEEAKMAAILEAKKQAEQAAAAASGKDRSEQSPTEVTSRQTLATASQNIQSEQARAEQILASLIAQNPILQGATVTVRDCPHNWQGCTYYKTGEIWIDPDHTAPLQRILVHECNHIIDWRSDGDIDNNDYHE